MLEKAEGEKNLTSSRVRRDNGLRWAVLWEVSEKVEFELDFFGENWHFESNWVGTSRPQHVYLVLRKDFVQQSLFEDLDLVWFSILFWERTLLTLIRFCRFFKEGSSRSFARRWRPFSVPERLPYPEKHCIFRVEVCSSCLPCILCDKYLIPLLWLQGFLT